MVFAPDSPLVSAVVASPNYGERRGRRADMLVLHYTGMPDADAALRRLCTRGSEVSAHYLVFEDGRIVQCVPEECRAWHAGVASWEGDTDINSRAIGVEIANPGHDDGYPDYPDAQVEALIALCRDVVTRHGIAAERVLGHSDVAPERKRDPGEKFPWERLHRAGVGHWVAPTPIAGGALFVHGECGTRVCELQERLADYGYGIDITGHYDAPTEQVVAAFQRHFRSARVDGIADSSTLDTLSRLLAARAVPA